MPGQNEILRMLAAIEGAGKLAVDANGSPIECLDAEQDDALSAADGASRVLRWVLGYSDGADIDALIIEPLMEITGRPVGLCSHGNPRCMIG